MDIYREADQLKSLGKYREAIENYVITADRHPELVVEAGTKKAFCYYRIGEHDQVFRCVDYLSKKDPENMILIDINAMSLYTIGRVVDAQKEYERMINNPRQNIRHKGYVGLGICLLKLNMISDGVKALEQARELAVGNSQKKNALHNLGWADYLRGDYSNAKDKYYRAYMIDNGDCSRDVVSFHSLAEACIELHEISQANDYLQKADHIIRNIIRSKELESENMFIRGKYYARTGRYDAALESFNQARRMSNPQNENRLVEIGEELFEIYTLKSREENNLMRAQVALELYILHKDANPEKAAGFLRVFREVDMQLGI